MDGRDDAAPAARQLPAGLKQGRAKQRDSQTCERMTRKGGFHSPLLRPADRQPGTRKNPRRVDRRGFEERIQIYRLTKKVAPFSCGLAAFLATFLFSQQDGFLVQAGWGS